MVEQAVILAAGMGTRLRNVLSSVPKGFLEINGVPIIEQSIQKLLKTGIKRIIIVTGHMSDFYDKLKVEYPEIETVKNDIYANSGSMYSFYAARTLIDDGFLLLESDLIYDVSALEVLQKDRRENIILLSGKTGSGDEVYVETSDNRIRNLSKKREELQSVTGELVGISKFSLPMYGKLIENAERMFADSLKVEYEQCIVETAADQTIEYLLMENLLWAEIDNEDHLKRAKEVIADNIT